MKSIKMAGLCLAAMLVVSVVAVASAAAEEQAKPYMIQCRSTPGTGHWNEEQCQSKPVSSGGNFDTRAAGAQGDETFSSSSGAGTLETVGGTKVTCTADKDVGKLTGDKQVGKVFITFTGCKSGVFSCTNTGVAGEIRTRELEGHLGYINKAKKEVGLDLLPVGGGLFAEFNCAGGIIEVKVRGSVIGRITPVNETTKKFTLAYKQTKGVQEPTKFEGEAEDVLETSIQGGAFAKSGIETTDEVVLQFDAEIVA